MKRSSASLISDRYIRRPSKPGWLARARALFFHISKKCSDSFNGTVNALIIVTRSLTGASGGVTPWLMGAKPPRYRSAIVSMLMIR